MSALSDYNQGVAGWTRETLRKTKNQVLRLAVQNSGPGYTQQKASTKLYLGEANKIVFQFPLYMVFFHKGAGRGYGGNKTGLFSRPNGTKGKTNPLSKGKIGTGKRRPHPWFNPVIEEQFPYLAELVNQYQGRKVVLNIQRILID